VSGGLSLKSHLILFGLALLLPVLLFSAFTIRQFERSEYASTERQAKALASALANTLDQDLSAKIVLLETLRLSPALRHGDFKSFYSAANEAHEKTGNHILLVDTSGRQIFNTHAPYGAQLPSVTDGESVRRVIETKQAYVSQIFEGNISKQLVYNVAIPVLDKNAVRYVLIMAPAARPLSAMIRQLALPAGWNASIWDQANVFAARSDASDKFIGKSVNPAVAKAAAEGPSIFTMNGRSGGPSIFAIARSLSSGWKVSIRVPSEVFNAPIRRSWAWLAAAGVVTTAIGLLFAWLLGNRLARAIRSATRVAEQISHDLPVESEKTQLREANEMIAVFEHSSRELRERGDHIEFTMRELLHRTKNLLAIIQAMARQTARTSPGPADFEAAFTGRLQSLSHCHDLLVQHNWHGARIQDVIARQLAPFVEENSDAVRLSGPNIVLEPKAAEQFSLAFHELGTNAAKHGSLTIPAGHVEISWRIDREAEEQHFCLNWTETGGPEVQSPSRHGFGRTVIERVTPSSLNGNATLTFAPEGVSWILRAPLSIIIGRPLAERIDLPKFKAARPS